MDQIESLPMGKEITPVPTPHFPDTLHAVIWRNWDVIELPVLAEVLKGSCDEVSALAASMGLPPQRRIDASERRRNYMTILRRNWHLLPYAQLCQLLDWDAATMRFALEKDDFMWVKLGHCKPRCAPVHYRAPDPAAQAQARRIAALAGQYLAGDALEGPVELPFDFIQRFSHAAAQPASSPTSPGRSTDASWRMVYPYFLRYGDPLMGDGIDDIPDGYLAELADSGINAIWLQGVLNTLYAWEPAPETARDAPQRLANLNRLVERCARFGIEVIMYLNEPRDMPLPFYDQYPELAGCAPTINTKTGLPEQVALCTSTPAVQEFLRQGVRHLFEQVPALGGLFIIAYSENLTNCFSFFHGTVARACPRCQSRGPEAVTAEVCQLMEAGIRDAGSAGKFIYYVWSTPKPWLDGIIGALPASTWVLAVSEWGAPLTRGSYHGKVNEYSISAVGPGQPSLEQWALARRHGLKTAAKMQAANSWELSSIPFIPALRLVGEHLSNVTDAGVEGFMLSWTLGGSPSPNLELAKEFSRQPRPTVQQAMHNVALRRFGSIVAPHVVQAWNLLSDAFIEFPFDIQVCYFGPQSLGPANLLFDQPTGLGATMVGFPYDDLETWRGPYSREDFHQQFTRLAQRWRRGTEMMEKIHHEFPSDAVKEQWRMAEAALIHFQSTANQIQFIIVRDHDPDAARAILQQEIILARRLMELVRQDSRIGFEATNQYAYMPLDLMEKILNCQDLLSRW
ncbi:MAG: hypothetical protein IT448_06130 [Phycisphaerales bacterium]|nr:hypothetical protein [Phycisphaerales bacterium]